MRHTWPRFNRYLTQSVFTKPSIYTLFIFLLSRHFNKNIASASQPPSLLIVATFNTKSFLLPLDIIYKYTYTTQPIPYFYK